MADVDGARARDRPDAATRPHTRPGADRRGTRRAASRCPPSSSIRFDYGSTVPWVRRLDDETLLAIGGPDALTLVTPVDLQPEGMSHRGRVRRPAGRPGAVRAHVVPVTRPQAEADRRGARAGADRDVLAGLDGGLPVRGRLHGSRPSVTARAQGAHLPADGRDRRGADDVAAGAHRRHSQLGLPILLAARCDLHALRAAQRGVQRRGPRMAQLAAACRRGRSGECPDPVRRRRRAARPGDRARLAARLRGIVAGACRQRRARAVPARRLRRGDGRAAPSRLAGQHVTGMPSDDHAWSLQRNLMDFLEGAWEDAGRGDLGGARPASAFHALEGARLGRVRPRGRHRRALGPPRPARPLAADPSGDPRRGVPRGLQRRAELVHAGLRIGRARRLDAPDPARRVPAADRSAGGRDGRGDSARSDARRVRRALSHGDAKRRRRAQRRRGRRSCRARSGSSMRC